MRVLLPSSTEPAVAMRRMSLRAVAISAASAAAAELEVDGVLDGSHQK